MKPVIMKNLLPRHMAFIMDGNGRWAQQRSLKRTEGHKQGLKVMAESAHYLFELGVFFVSYYAFSLDNWNRSETEVEYLNHLIQEFYEKEFPQYKAKNKKVLISGVKDRLSSKILDIIHAIEKETSTGTDGVLHLCYNYGGRREIVEAVKKAYLAIQEGNLEIQDLNTDNFYQYLLQPSVPEVDFLMRTSGEYRLSDFLLYQLSYTELYFIEKMWPDLTKNDLDEAIKVYQNRVRRFGRIYE